MNSEALMENIKHIAKKKKVGRRELKIPGLAILKEVVSNLIKAPATINYPFAQTEVPNGFRGLLNFDINKCLGCGSCARVCPTGTIKMVPSDKTRLKKAPYFELAKCVFCGSCVDICPTKALSFTPNYHTSIIRKDELIIDPNRLPETKSE